MFYKLVTWLAYLGRVIFDVKPKDRTHTSATILADSMNTVGDRLTTFLVVFPRSILAEVNTHRMLSRNSASSRARPIKKVIHAVLHDLYTPGRFGKNKPGMSAAEYYEPGTWQYALGAALWRLASWCAVAIALAMNKLGFHKQDVNRLLEPFIWHTAIISATDWSHWVSQRLHEAPHPEIHKLAQAMVDAQDRSTPKVLQDGEWHLPLIGHDGTNEIPGDAKIKVIYGLTPTLLPRISAGRVARVSYMTHDGRRDVLEDFRLYDKLAGSDPKHMSPLEHPAVASTGTKRGNYTGFTQLRWFVEQDDLELETA